MALSGKYNRCSLGQASDLDTQKELQEASQEAVAQTSKPSAVVTEPDTAKEMKQQTMADMASACQAFLTLTHAVEDSDAIDDVQSKLWQVAKFDRVIATLLKSMGCTVKVKFPSSFDTGAACKLAFLHASTFIDDMQALLRKGNLANIHQGRTDAWSDELLRSRDLFQGFPLFDEIWNSTDVLDAMTSLNQAANEVKELKARAAAKPVTLQSGRKVKPMEKKVKEQNVSAIKRKLSELSSSGDSLACEALKKLDETEEPESKKAKNKKRSTKKIAAKDRYARTPGDELRLKRKREIVIWQNLIQYYHYALCANRWRNSNMFVRGSNCD